MNNDLTNLRKSFQDGCNAIYNKCKSLGVTPISNSPTNINNAIQSIYNTRYTSGYNSGKESANCVINVTTNFPNYMAANQALGKVSGSLTLSIINKNVSITSNALFINLKDNNDGRTEKFQIPINISVQ